MLFRAGAATAHVDLAAATSSRRGKSAGAAAARVNLAAADTGREVCRQAQQDAGAHASRRPHATMALLSYGDQLVSINSSYCHTMFIPEVFLGYGVVLSTAQEVWFWVSVSRTLGPFSVRSSWIIVFLFNYI